MKGKCISKQEFEFYKLTEDNLNDFLKIRLSKYIEKYGEFTKEEFDGGIDIEFNRCPYGFEFHFGYFYVNNSCDDWEEYTTEYFSSTYNIVARNIK